MSRYPIPPWPQDVPRKEMPEPFWTRYVRHMVMGQILGSLVAKRLEEDDTD